MGEILGRVVVGRRVRRDEHDDRIKDIETMSVAPDYAGRTAMRAGRGDDGPFPRCNGGEPFAFGFLRRFEWYDRTWKRRTGYTWHTSWPSEPIL
jgi:hypothetical protein